MSTRGDRGEGRAVDPRTRAETDVGRVRVAGFWRRGLAAGVDALVVAPFALAACGLVVAASGHPLPRLGELGLGYVVGLALNGGAIGPAALALAGLIGCLYLFLFTILRGQTPGGRLLGVRIIDVWGVRPSPSRALLRTGVALASLLGCSLGFLWIAFDREKRGLHDWLAGTYVVRVRSVFQLQRLARQNAALSAPESARAEAAAAGVEERPRGKRASRRSPADPATSV